MPTSDERLKRISRDVFLGAFGQMGDLEDRVVARVAAIMDEDTFKPGETIFAEGDAPRALYLMHDGAIRMSRNNGATWRVEGRWALGLHAAILQEPHTTTAIAETPLRLLRFPASAWLDMLEDSFALTSRVIGFTSRVVAGLEERIPSLPPNVPSPKRVSTLVDKLAFMLDVRMLRGAGVQALADLATVAREVTYEAGDVVHAPAAERRELAFVAAGEVVARNLQVSATRKYVARDLVCGAAAFGPAAFRWEATAASDVRALVVPVDAWFDAMEEHFDLARAALSALAARRQLLIEHLAKGGELVLRWRLTEI